MYWKIPVNELHKSKEPVNKKNKGHKSASNLSRDFPQPDPASCGKQSVELQ